MKTHRLAIIAAIVAALTLAPAVALAAQGPCVYGQGAGECPRVAAQFCQTVRSVCAAKGYVDANGDGVCDNYAPGNRQGRGCNAAGNGLSASRCAQVTWDGSQAGQCGQGLGRNARQ